MKSARRNCSAASNSDDSPSLPIWLAPRCSWQVRPRTLSPAIPCLSTAAGRPHYDSLTCTRSRLHFENLHRELRVRLALARYSGIETIELRHIERSFGAVSRRHFGHKFVMVRIFLRENRGGLRARQVNSFSRGVEPHIVVERRAGNCGDDLAAIGIEHKKCWRITRGDEQAMIGLV